MLMSQIACQININKSYSNKLKREIYIKSIIDKRNNLIYNAFILKLKFSFMLFFTYIIWKKMCVKCMLNCLWAGMILVGICYGAITGNMEAVGNGVLESAKEAVSLCISMAGAVALWNGLMEIALDSGLVERWKMGLRPLLRYLFPRLDLGGEAAGYIATNFIANIFSAISPVN